MIKKDIKLSNLKGLLIFLVVFGHLIEHYNESYKELFLFIYAFHMPLFVFISGYLAKRVKVRKVINLALLYLVFQTFFILYQYLLGQYDQIAFNYDIPEFHLWYIVSLVLWYLIALILIKLNLSNGGKWITFTIIFILCFMARWYVKEIDLVASNVYTHFNTYTLSYMRTVTFAPFFFVGFFMKKSHLEKLYNLLNNLKAKLFLTLSFFMVVFLYLQSNHEMELVFRGSWGVGKWLEDKVEFSTYFVDVSLQYIIACGISILVINFINNKHSILSKWGDHSLTIFLFHPVVVFLLWEIDFFTNWNPDTQIIFFFSLTMATTYLLGSDFFVKITKYICNPYKSIEEIYLYLKNDTEERQFNNQQ